MRRTTKFGACAGRGFDKQGFTLIELLTVVAILAVLAAIVVPTLSRARDKARAAICSGTMRSLGLAINMYADDNQDILPCPDDTFGDSANWYYAINPYILRMKTTNVQVVASQRMDLYKQDPIWVRFTGDSATNGRSIKMNRKLVGKEPPGGWNISSSITNAVPIWRKRSDIEKAATTVLLFDGIVETATISTDWRRFDGWEPKVALRHMGGANIFFVDGHGVHWKDGTPGSSNGWQSDQSGLDWWVD
jgi:prepilin-type N-terminal cleavage/methylation domain-containing protein/prepilin-type processing-associated H-X9-DG protein